MQPCGDGRAIEDGDANQQVVGTRFGILDLNVKVPIVIEDAGIDELD